MSKQSCAATHGALTQEQHRIFQAKAKLVAKVVALFLEERFQELAKDTEVFAHVISICATKDPTLLQSLRLIMAEVRTSLACHSLRSLSTWRTCTS